MVYNKWDKWFKSRKKFSRLTMGFGYFMYSHSLVPVIDPWGSGRDKVGIRALISIADLWVIVLCLFLYYCGIRLSNVSSVIIASRIPRCVCSLLCLIFIALFYQNEKESRRCSCCWSSQWYWAVLLGWNSCSCSTT